MTVWLKDVFQIWLQFPQKYQMNFQHHYITTLSTNELFFEIISTIKSKQIQQVNMFARYHELYSYYHEQNIVHSLGTFIHSLGLL